MSGLSEEGHAGGQFPRPDLHERLARVLARTKPDVVIACYGMNDGIYLPYSDERFQKFKDGILWLRQQVSESGAKLIHMTPPTFDELKGGHPGYSQTLDRYAEWLMAQRAAGWDVIDLHGPMNRYLSEHRKLDPDFFLAGDGVHANEIGHWIMARQLLLHLGAKDLTDVDSAKAMLATHPDGEGLLKLVEQRQRTLKDAWLTATGHQRPGMSKGLPLDQARAQVIPLGAQISRSSGDQQRLPAAASKSYATASLAGFASAYSHPGPFRLFCPCDPCRPSSALRPAGSHSSDGGRRREIPMDCVAIKAASFPLTRTGHGARTPTIPVSLGLVLSGHKIKTNTGSYDSTKIPFWYSSLGRLS